MDVAVSPADFLLQNWLFRQLLQLLLQPNITYGPDAESGTVTTIVVSVGKKPY